MGLYLIWRKDTISASDSSLKSLLPAKYLLTLMGFFAFYCGLIYNDFMSISPNLFGSCYKINSSDKSITRNNNCIYPFGVDPVWSISTNDISFFNSLKMKLAVILGVT